MHLKTVKLCIWLFEICVCLWNEVRRGGVFRELEIWRSVYGDKRDTLLIDHHSIAFLEHAVVMIRTTIFNQLKWIMWDTTPLSMETGKQQNRISTTHSSLPLPRFHPPLSHPLHTTPSPNQSLCPSTHEKTNMENERSGMKMNHFDRSLNEMSSVCIESEK